jgi:hypothetical protein
MDAVGRVYELVMLTIIGVMVLVPVWALLGLLLARRAHRGCVVFGATILTLLVVPPLVASLGGEPMDPEQLSRRARVVYTIVASVLITDLLASIAFMAALAVTPRRQTAAPSPES